MTAEEFLIDKSKSQDKRIVLNALNNGQFTIDMMVEFAKIKAIEELSNVIEHPGKPGYKRSDVVKRIEALKKQ